MNTKFGRIPPHPEPTADDDRFMEKGGSVSFHWTGERWTKSRSPVQTQLRTPSDMSDMSDWLKDARAAIEALEL